MSRTSKTKERVFDAIEKFIAEHSYSPSYDEIGQIVGVGKTAVRFHVRNLRNENRITFQDNISRTIQIVGSGTNSA